jgi:hypothetical protein
MNPGNTDMYLRSSVFIGGEFIPIIQYTRRGAYGVKVFSIRRSGISHMTATTT